MMLAKAELRLALRFSSRRALATVTLILSVLALFSTVSAQPPAETMRIYGRVQYESGDPVEAATVVLLDWTTMGYQTYLTDTQGEYSARVVREDAVGVHQYVVYALHADRGTGGIDVVPAMYPADIYDAKARITSTKEVSFTLLPGAVFEFSGGLWYILGSGAPNWHTYEVLGLPEEAPEEGMGVPIRIYGSPPYRYGVAPDVRFLPESVFSKRYVAVPAGTPVRVKVVAEFYVPRYRKATTISFVVDRNGEAFNLTAGEQVLFDLRPAGYWFSIGALRGLEGSVETRLAEAESIGFFVGAERDDLKQVSTTVLRAEELLGIKPEPSDDVLKQIRFLLLEKAYYEIGLLERRIADMYAISQSHSVFFPFFFAVFTVIFASFIFENEKRKIWTSLVVYPLLIAALFYVYPGFSIILNPKTVIIIELLAYRWEIPGVQVFSASVVAAIAATMGVFFLFPRVYKEPDVAGRTSLRSILSTIFSIAKRNVKRRKLRSLFCILGIGILVLGFTALTSFSRVYGVVTEGATSTETSATGVLVEKIPVEEANLLSPQSFFSPKEVASLRDYGATTTVPKAENLPSQAPLLSLKSRSGRSAMIYGVLGVAPNLEDRVTSLNHYVSGTGLGENQTDGLLLSAKLAAQLGVAQGDPVQVYSITSGVETLAGNFTIAGLLEDALFTLKDVNGRAFTPSKYVDSKLVATNETETVLFTWETALTLHSQIGTSRVFVFLADASPSRLNAFTSSMVYKEYVAWMFDGGRVTKRYIGSVLEIRGLESFIVPLVLVILNVGLVMMNLAYERVKEVSLLSMLGLNPGHIASLFIAESLVMGFVGGGLGYFFGLGAYRFMSALGAAGQIGVREKLEWYWSIVAIAIALTVAVVSAIRPATKAAMAATPSMVKKVKMAEPDRQRRERELFKVYQTREYGLPIRVHEQEDLFFFATMMDRLGDLVGAYRTRVEDLAMDEQLMTDGTRVKKISFTYSFVEGEKQLSTVNQITATKRPDRDYYSLTLSSEPKVPGLPESAVETTVSAVRDLLMEWDRRKKQIMSGIRP